MEHLKDASLVYARALPAYVRPVACLKTYFKRKGRLKMVKIVVSLTVITDGTGAKAYFWPSNFFIVQAIGFKGLPRTNTLAYYRHSNIWPKKVI